MSNKAGGNILSVLLITYNHEKYIRQALEGILMQDVNFNYDIIVGEDCSTDDTRTILLEYAGLYPDKFKLIFREKNIGANLNVYDAISKCSGKYIAALEGDDYWTDPFKLQKQVDFLERNPEYTLTCGGYVRLYNNQSKDVISSDLVDSSRHSDKGFSFSLEDTQKGWLTKSLTLVFRRDAFPFEEWKNYKYFKDVHMVYHILKKGKGFYFKEIFGVYNVHPGGAHGMSDRRIRRNTEYNNLKEIYEVNGDEYSRAMYFVKTCNLLRYDLYHKYEGNSIERRLSLFKAACKLMKKKGELKRLLRSLLPA